MSTGNQAGSGQQSSQRSVMGQEKPSGSSESEHQGMSDVVRDAQDTLMETAHQTLDSAKETAQNIATQTQEQVGDVVSETVNQASQAISDVKEQATSTFIAQRDRAVEMLAELAEALKTTGQSLASDASGSAQNAQAAKALGPFVTEAAERLSQSADFLRNKDMSSLMHDAQTMARKQPLLFLGAMFGVGIAGARMFKGMNDGGDSSNPQGESSQPTPANLTEGGKSGSSDQMSQRFDQGFGTQNQESFATPPSEDETGRPDAFLGLDESTASTGAATSRSRETMS